jgi:tRNA A-37 threonylcarbamoyl transferase component Bud32
VTTPREPSALQPRSPSQTATLPPAAVVAAPPLTPPPVPSDGVTFPPPQAPSESETLAPPAPAPAFPGCDAVPGYEILRELGRGGMGVVYQARHTKLNRLVALKMILAGSHAGAADLARFQTEAEAIARLQHPNIVQVYEVGEHEGKPFFSLEFCGGGSLEKKLNGTPLPARKAAALVETLARAMQAAHEKGVIHRDLKPANVLLAEDGTPKITDFGLAKKLDEAGQTQSGAIIGTPSYMAPEQAGGKSGSIGPAADVYALGAILYECLTGRPPFKAATALDTIMQVVSDDPVPPRQLQTKTPRDLETICLKCLHKEAAKRYGTARELADDLRRFLGGEPIRARPVGRVERMWKSIKRRPALALLLIPAFVAAITCLLPVAFSLASGGVTAAALGVWLYRVMTARLREAREKLQLARQIVDDCYTQVARSWLNDEQSKDDLQREFLIKTQDLYEILAEERDGDPTISRGTGLAHFHVGQVFHRALKNMVEAERSYAKAIAIQEQLCQKYPMVAVYRQDLADSLYWREVLLRERGLRLQEAEELHCRALELQEQLTTDNLVRLDGGAVGETKLMTDQNSPQLLVTLLTEPEAATIVAYLDSLGIQAEIWGANSSPMWPEGHADVRVVVRQADLARAREAMAGLDEGGL